MTRTSFRLEGFDAQLEEIAGLEDGVDDAVDAALAAGAEMALDGMQRRVPVDSGHLKDSLQASEAQADGNYHFVEVGQIDVDAKTAIYGNVQEYGSSSVDAQPFVRPTIDQDRAAVRAAQKGVLDEFVKK